MDFRGNNFINYYQGIRLEKGRAFLRGHPVDWIGDQVETISEIGRNKFTYEYPPDETYPYNHVVDYNSNIFVYEN